MSVTHCLTWLLPFALLAGSFARECRAQGHDLFALRGKVNLQPEREFDDRMALPFWGDDVAVAGAAGLFLGGDLASALGAMGRGVLERTEDGFYETALKEYRQFLQEDEASLVLPGPHELDPSETLTSRDRHEWMQRRIGRLPPSLRERFRDLIDRDAERLLQEGETTRTPGPLRQLTRDYSLSRHVPRAFALLGDLAFERGDFDEALDRWRPLAPLPSFGAASRYDGIPIDLPRVQAKQLLALIFLGRFSEAERELDAFKSLHPKARGRLAGGDDSYHAIVSRWLQTRRQDGAESPGGPWPTFGGSPTRNGMAAHSPSHRLWIDGPAWTAPLASIEPQPPSVRLSATRTMQIPAAPYHPIIAEGQVVVCDGKSVVGYDLLTGKEQFRYVGPALEPPPDAVLMDPPAWHPRFTLTAAPGRVFARLGGTQLGGEGDAASVLVCLELGGSRKPAAEAKSGRLLWKREATTPDGASAVFESDPLVHGDSLYVAVSHAAEGKTRTWLWCCDLSGTLVWRTLLAESVEFDRGIIGRFRPHLLTWAGTSVIHTNHAGAVVAVDPWTGRRRWALRYLSCDRAESPREVSPALYDRGRVYVAPADSPDLYCIDAESGAVVWEKPWTRAPRDILPDSQRASEVVHLLNVVDGRLIFTDRYRLQALDAATGARLVWQQPTLGKLPSLGRGLIAGDWVFWPTADPEVSLRVVTLAEGKLQRPPEAANRDPDYYDLTTLRNVPAGNLVIGEGCLVVAGPKQLTVYVGEARRRASGRPEARRPEASRRTTPLSTTPRQPTNGMDIALSPAAGPRTTPPTFIPVRLASGIVPPRDTTFRLDAGSRFGAELRWMLDGFLFHEVRSPHPGRLNAALIWRNRELAALDVNSGKILWQTALPSIAAAAERHESPWVGRHRDVIVLGFAPYAAALDAVSGKCTWVYHQGRLIVPDPGRHPRGPPSGSAATILNGYHFVGDLLAFFEGDRQVVLLDPINGERKARVWAEGGVIHPLDGGKVQPFVDAWIDDSGRLKTRVESVAADHERMTFADARRTRATLDGTLRLVGRAGGIVELVDVRRDHVLWSHAAPWRTSLTGAAPTVLGDGDRLLALIPRNHGAELTRLDRATGRPLWSVPPHRLHDGFEKQASLLDDRALYYIHRGVIHARALGDGRLLWQRPLPHGAGAWHLACFGDHLVAWPHAAAGIPVLPGPGNPILASLAVAWGRRGIGQMPVTLVQRTDGAIAREFRAPHDYGPASVQPFGDALVVGAGGKIYAVRPE